MIISPNSSKNNSTLEGSFLSKVQGIAILDALNDAQNSRIIKTASSEKKVLSAIKAFVNAIEALGIESNVDENTSISSISKLASQTNIGDNESKSDLIKIASLEIKDSHHNIDVSMDTIKKDGKALTMVSFLMTDSYLGKYIIKRNYYYLPTNAVEANETYNELVRKSARVKNRYLTSQIRFVDVKPEIKSFLDGIKGDFESLREDDLGTTVKRNKVTGHEAYGPPYIGQY